MSDHVDFHDRARRRAGRRNQGWPGVLAWFAGLGIHVTLAVLLVL